MSVGQHQEVAGGQRWSSRSQNCQAAPGGLVVMPPSSSYPGELRYKHGSDAHRVPPGTSPSRRARSSSVQREQNHVETPSRGREPLKKGSSGTSCPGGPRSPSAELGLLSSVCSFSSFSRFSAAHAPDSSCCRTAGQNSRSSLRPTAEPSLRLWMAKSSEELKHCRGRRRRGRLEPPPGWPPRRGGGSPKFFFLPWRGWRAAGGGGRRWRAPLPRPGG